MGTKNSPGQFDGYAKADPDEPMFVLLGRDPLACILVQLWAEERERNEVPPDVRQARERLKDWAAAKGKAAEFAATAHLFGDAKTEEAHACAVAMAKWAISHGQTLAILDAALSLLEDSIGRAAVYEFLKRFVDIEWEGL